MERVYLVDEEEEGGVERVFVFIEDVGMRVGGGLIVVGLRCGRFYGGYRV